MKTRFGLSAKTPCPAPHVHFSFPGKLEIGFGQFGATSYAPEMSCPPFWPGTAAKLGCCGDCPSTRVCCVAIRTLSARTIRAVPMVHEFLRMTFLLYLDGTKRCTRSPANTSPV